MSSTKGEKFQLQREDTLVMKKQADSGLMVRIPEIENAALAFPVRAAR